jgi:hypothetical protein
MKIPQLRNVFIKSLQIAGYLGRVIGFTVTRQKRAEVNLAKYLP